VEWGAEYDDGRRIGEWARVGGRGGRERGARSRRREKSEERKEWEK
jgi:hypothetical protein